MSTPQVGAVQRCRVALPAVRVAALVLQVALKRAQLGVAIDMLELPLGAPWRVVLRQLCAQSDAHRLPVLCVGWRGDAAQGGLKRWGARFALRLLRKKKKPCIAGLCDCPALAGRVLLGGRLTLAEALSAKHGWDARLASSAVASRVSRP